MNAPKLFTLLLTFAKLHGSVKILTFIKIELSTRPLDDTVKFSVCSGFRIVIPVTAEIRYICILTLHGHSVKILKRNAFQSSADELFKYMLNNLF